MPGGCIVVCILILCRQDITGLFFHMLVLKKMGPKWSVFHPALVVICNVRRISVKKDREHTKTCKGSRHKQLWKQNMKGKRPTHILTGSTYKELHVVRWIYLMYISLGESKVCLPDRRVGRNTRREIMWIFSSQKIVYLKGKIYLLFLKTASFLCLSR